MKSITMKSKVKTASVASCSAKGHHLHSCPHFTIDGPALKSLASSFQFSALDKWDMEERYAAVDKRREEYIVASEASRKDAEATFAKIEKYRYDMVYKPHLVFRMNENFRSDDVRAVSAWLSAMDPERRTAFSSATSIWIDEKQNGGVRVEEHSEQSAALAELIATIQRVEGRNHVIYKIGEDGTSPTPLYLQERDGGKGWTLSSIAPSDNTADQKSTVTTGDDADVAKTEENLK